LYWVLVVFLFIILLLTFLREIKSFDKMLQRFPTFMQFVPNWSFFAPVPNMHDYRLFHRVIDKNGAVFEWQASYTLRDQRPFYVFLWNPQKRFLKGFLDLSHDLLKFCNAVQDKNQICSSLPYLHILNFVDAQAHIEEAEKIQFVIMTDSALHPTRVAFLSEIHPITPKAQPKHELV